MEPLTPEEQQEFAQLAQDIPFEVEGLIQTEQALGEVQQLVDGVVTDMATAAQESEDYLSAGMTHLGASMEQAGLEAARQAVQ